MIPRDEIERRRRAAAEEPFSFAPAGAGVEVRGASGTVHLVLPDLTGHPSTCDCPDYRSGKAGTCKHVEAVRLHRAGTKPSLPVGNEARVARPAPAAGRGPEVLVFDLETRRSFDEVAGRKADRLGLSLAVVYSYRDDAFTTYFEDDAGALVARLLAAPLVVGFNHKRFDLEVLRPYAGGADLSRVRSFDLLEDLQKRLGHRVGLDGCCRATLGAAKSGHGLEAIAWFREGRLAELEGYCRDDVRLTRDLFDHGRTRGFVVVEKRDGAGGLRNQPVQVDWARAWPGEVPLPAGVRAGRPPSPRA